MASQSELSFGARLLRANNLLTYLSNFDNYLPPRSEEATEKFGELLKNISAANAKESGLQQKYNMAVSNRHNAFRADALSVFKILALIRGSVQAQYGKDSKEFTLINTAVNNIRVSKIVKKSSKSDELETSISKSEQSYGSLTQYFTDLVNKLSQLDSYNPSNTSLQIHSLQQFVEKLNELNQEVASTYHLLKISKNYRRGLYEELSERTNRIKAYIKSNYGTKSEQYTLIKGLRI